jgi:hypothetical protein
VILACNNSVWRDAGLRATPTQIVDYQESSSVTYPDLETQANSVAVALTKQYGITFELTL